MKAFRLAQFIETPSLFDNFARGDVIPVKCDYCGKTKRMKKSFIKNKAKHYKHFFCNQFCKSYGGGTTLIKCLQCGKHRIRSNAEIAKHKRSFCSQSCAATYNNSHKKHGYRRSKLEIWLENRLTKKYKKGSIMFNPIDIIGYEIDILFVKYHIGFEINGIFHYKPIYGKQKLRAIKRNDRRKRLAAKKKGIKIITINVSKMKRFTEAGCETVLQKILSKVKELRSIH